MKRLALILSALALGAAAAAHAQPQPYPNKAIRWVVPFAPGGTTDILARTDRRKTLGVARRPGDRREQAGRGRRRRRDVRREGARRRLYDHGRHDQHARDQRVAVQGPSIRPVKDFVPIMLIARVPNMLVVNPSVPAKNVGELIALLKKDPGKYTFASSGNGTSQHLSGELFKTMTGVEMQHIPYKGSPPALQDVVGGAVSMTFDNITTAWPLAKNGNLRALAVTTAKRSSIAPDVPTLAESGLAGYEVGSWQGVFAPAGTPPEIVKRLNAEMVKILNLPDVRRRS